MKVEEEELLFNSLCPNIPEYSSNELRGGVSLRILRMNWRSLSFVGIERESNNPGFSEKSGLWGNENSNHQSFWMTVFLPKT